MALRQLILTKRIAEMTAKLEALREKDADFEARAANLKTREADLEASVEEITEETPQEDKDVVDAAVGALEKDQEALDKEMTDNDAEKTNLTDEIKKLSDELNELNSRAKLPPAAAPKNEERQDYKSMEIRDRFFKTTDQRDAFFARDDVKDFLVRLRGMGAENRSATGAELGIPIVMLDLIKETIVRYSKLIGYVRLRPVKGKARQNVVGDVPEGIWVESISNLNELDISFAQVETDGFKVGGYIAIPNSYLEDDDNMALGAEVMDLMGQAIGLGIDKAIVYGTGVKMPVGFVTRLKETSQPSYWGTNQGTFTDLHTSNVKKIDKNATTGAAFYAALISELGIASPKKSNGIAFWVVNRKTHIDLMAKALAFDAAAALVAGIKNQMPIIGGDIIELEFMPDYEIAGGFGSLYLLAEREGTTVASSDIPMFIQDQTVFKCLARYDGKPVRGEAFVVVNYANQTVTTTKTFATDYANTALGALAVTSTAGTNSGDTNIDFTGGESSGTTFAYKIGGKPADVKCGDKSTGYTAITTNADVTAATGKIITVVEFDGNGKAIKVGSAQVVAKA